MRNSVAKKVYAHLYIYIGKNLLYNMYTTKCNIGNVVFVVLCYK